MKRPLRAEENARGVDAEVAVHGGEGGPAERPQRRRRVHSAQRHETPAFDEAKPEHAVDAALGVRSAQGFDVLSEAADERHLWRSGETGKPTAGSETDDAIGELGFEEAAGHGEAAELVVDSVGGEGGAVAQRNVG